MLLTAVLDALSVVLPVGCAGCGRADRALCPACRVAIAPRGLRQPLTDGTPVFSALRYEGVVRETVLGLKEQGRTDVAPALAASLADSLAELPPGVELVGMPTARAAFARRGFDPVRLLVRKAGFEPVPGMLRFSRAMAQQKSLDREARARNLENSMRASSACAGRRFVLVDDVLTTGATLREGVRAVRAAGGEVLAAATLATTPLRFGDSSGRLRQTRDIPGSRV
jgi:ComF family protein